MKKYISFAVSLLGSLHTAVAAEATEIRTAAQDAPPKFIKSGDKMTGLCVDIFHAIEKVTPDLKFSGINDYVPLPRIEHELESGKLDVFCGLAKTKERLAKMDFVETPIYTLSWVLAARTDEKEDIKSWDDLRKLGDKGVVVASYGTAYAKVLQEQKGLFIDDGAKDLSVNLKKVQAGRGRFAFHNDLSMAYQIKLDNLQSNLKILPTKLVSEGSYLVVNKKLDPAIKGKLNKAIDSLAKSGELSDLYLPYKPAY